MDLLKLKYKKRQKKPMKGMYRNRNSNISKIIYGNFGIKCLENSLIEFKHLEATRKFLSKRLKKIAKIWIRINPKYPVSQKMGDKRMGKGKGIPVTFIFKVRAGSVLLEIEPNQFIETYRIINFINNAIKKLPMKAKVYRI